MSERVRRIIERCKTKKRSEEEKNKSKLDWDMVSKYCDHLIDQEEEDNCSGDGSAGLVPSYSHPDDYAQEKSPLDGVINVFNQLRYDCECSNELKSQLGRWCWGGRKDRGEELVVNTDGSIKIGESGSPIEGGCGAIARDGNAKLIAASAMLSPRGPMSVFYHKLEGVMVGLQLAKANKFRVVHLAISLYFVIELLESQTDDEDCFYQGEDSVEVVNILREINEMLKLPDWTVYICHCPRGANLAAEYLAKLFKEVKVSKHDDGAFADACPEAMKVLISDKFGKKLNDILDYDATGEN